jgi:dTDP-3-amino-3,4,6-trideoxy-alpha-D-glucose transaminase
VIQTRIPFMSLAPRGEEAAAIRQAIDRVIASGWFVLGPELEAFEAEFAAACGAKHAVGVGNGTDALALALRALGIHSGDEVITTPLSAAFTALAVMMTGATPVFADIDPVRLTIDPERIAALIGPRTRAILPVHLYGQPADMTPILRLAKTHNIPLVEDCCQAHLATSAGGRVGTIGDAAAFSFYPTKNLGAFGDAGAIVVSDAGRAGTLRRMRNGGQRDRYAHEQFGVNSRLDELQAAVLRAKLPGLAAATARRRAIAAQYRRLLRDAPVEVPPECDPGHVYHLFVVRSRERAALQAHLAAAGIETLIHYPVPIPDQEAFRNVRHTDCPVAAQICGELLSLPIYPSLSDEDVMRVAGAIKAFR